MTAAKTPSVITPASGGTLAQGSTKAAPGVISNVVDLTAVGSTATLTASLTNGSSAPTSPAVLVAQISFDNTNWRDWALYAGDTIASSFYTFGTRIPLDARYARWVAYGNATNPVTVTFEASVSTVS